MSLFGVAAVAAVILVSLVLLYLVRVLVIGPRSRRQGGRRSRPATAAAASVTTHPSSQEEEDDEGFVDPNQMPHVPLRGHPKFTLAQMESRSSEYYSLMNKRRSVRFFSERTFPRAILERCLMTAGTSPSGAHCQPWTWVCVSTDRVKAQIRRIVEAEEKVNYERRMGAQWVEDLAHIGTDWRKPYLTTVPYIVLLFKQTYGLLASDPGKKKKHYYYNESCAIAGGMFISAIHNVGLATLTSTPLNAGAQLRELLGRPKNEKLLLLLPVGFPSKDATVPNLQRKSLEELAVFC